jgi:hypothetical protein
MGESGELRWLVSRYPKCSDISDLVVHRVADSNRLAQAALPDLDCLPPAPTVSDTGGRSEVIGAAGRLHAAASEAEYAPKLSRACAVARRRGEEQLALLLEFTAFLDSGSHRSATQRSAVVPSFASFVVVLVVAAKPHNAVVFIAALRSAVKNRVVAHQKLRTAGIAGVAAVDGVALAREGAEAVPLG